MIGDICIFFRPILDFGVGPTGDRARSVVVVSGSSGAIITVGRPVITAPVEIFQKKPNKRARARVTDGRDERKRQQNTAGNGRRVNIAAVNGSGVPNHVADTRATGCGTRGGIRRATSAGSRLPPRAPANERLTVTIAADNAVRGILFYLFSFRFIRHRPSAGPPNNRFRYK